MLPWESRWRRFRRRLGPVTRRVPAGHAISEAGVYGRLIVPGLPRPEKRFVIFAQGRSGSTLLADLLNSHPDILCDDEVLTFRRHRPALYAEGCSTGHRVAVWGFKVKVYQLTQAQALKDPGAFLRDLHDRRWLVIHLHRRNVARQALSSMLAEQRGGLYHRRATATGSDVATTVTIDPDELIWRCHERERFVQQEAEALAGLPHVRLTYEDDLAPAAMHQSSVDRVFAYLGVDSVPVTTVLTRIGASPLEGVRNHDEVRRKLAGTRFGEMLERD